MKEITHNAHTYFFNSNNLLDRLFRYQKSQERETDNNTLAYCRGIIHIMGFSMLLRNV